MKIRQKIKIILQVLFICLVLLVNASVYQKYNYFSAARHLKYIPSNALLSITFNTKAFGTKVFKTFLYKNEEFSDLIESIEPEKRKPGNVFESGLDLTNQASVYLNVDHTNPNLGYVSLIADIASRSNVESSLIKQGFKAVAGKNGIFKKDEKNYVVLNDEIIAFVAFINEKIEDKDINDALFAVIEPKENSIEKLALPYLEKDEELIIIGQPKHLSKESEWIEQFISYGSLKGDAFELHTDILFNTTISTYFSEHKTDTSFNFDDLDGYAYLKSTFNAPNANDIFSKFKIITFNDSLTNMLSPALQDQYASGLELYCFNLQKAELILSPDAPTDLKILSKNFLLPAFDFRLHCSNAAKIDTIFNQLSAQNQMVKEENNWYLWNRDKYYSLYFGIKNDWLNITTKKITEHQMPETGYSNVFYFNSDKFSQKLPFFGSQLIADELKVFEHVLFYSTSAKGNKLHTEGKIVFASKKDALLELIRLMIKFSDKDLSAILSKAA